MVRRSHLRCMSNHTIAAPITTWAEARTTDREVLNRAEVAALLTVDARTVDHAIEDGTIPAIDWAARAHPPAAVPGRVRHHLFGVGMTTGRPGAGGRSRREKGTGSITSYQTKAGRR